MALFSKGQHSFNKKYERFSDVYKYSTKYRKRTRRGRANISRDEGAQLPSRMEKFGKKRTGLWAFIWSSFPLRYLARLASKFRSRMRVIRETRESALLGYIPTKLFIGLCVATCGLYPYMWMWGNTYAFNTICGKRIDEGSVKRLAVLGFMVQLLVPTAAISRAVWHFTKMEAAYQTFQISLFVFAALYALVIFPMRCFNYFCVRWVLRGAVIEWDSEGVMVGRTITSWVKLFLFGSAYIQYHINRLMGLGMPGFADASEIEPDATLSERLDNYVVIGKSDRAVASWTKDDFEPEYDDDMEYYEEEYNG
jgi:hypothetical protein